MRTHEHKQPQSEGPLPSKARGVLRRKCACGTHTAAGAECSSCSKKREGEVLRRSSPAGHAHDGGVPAIVHDVLGTPGSPLDSSTRSLMETRFGHDFSKVRVHADAKAAESARAVNALAYTVGHNIAFGAGQYSSGTAAGRRLLAHELTHVLQQEQSGGAAIPQHKLEVAPPATPAEQEADDVARSVVEGTSPRVFHPLNTHPRSVRRGMIQRTPAPPTYDGVTGVRDLSKLRIDPVPDLDTSKFVSPLVVNAHVLDPAIVHFTWMLYNPKDEMIAGFSTLPNRPNSTTETFTLKPSHFSGAGFVEGTYILRLSGLNDKHQPIVYADRDITVVKSDLTTGTELATTYGKLTFTKYGSTDANPPATPRWTVDVAIKFMPDTAVPCTDVTYIQALESVDDTGKSQHAFTSAEQKARETPLTWSIDRVAGAPSPFYIMGRDAGKVVDVNEDPVTGTGGWGTAGKGGATPKAATLLDTPSWNKATHDKFETCAICRSGANKGEVYGCATWGYTATAAGKVTLHPRSFRQTPSDQFKEAIDAWNTWRATVPAATRPDEAPALKKP